VEFLSAMEPFECRSVGFIGLGAMGKPMAGHLAKKLPQDTLIYVFDVVQTAIDELCLEFPNKVVKSANAKEVAENTVRNQISLFLEKVQADIHI
jgi:6-phosphogluconate dehydrogenase (decarboxylating)